MPENPPRPSREDFEKYSSGEPFGSKLRGILTEGKSTRGVMLAELDQEKARQIQEERERWQNLSFAEQQSRLRELAASKEEVETKRSRAEEELEKNYELTKRILTAIGNYSHSVRVEQLATLDEDSEDFKKTLFAFVLSGELENYKRFYHSEQGQERHFRLGFLMERLASYDTGDPDDPDNPLPLRYRDFVGEEELFPRFREKYEKKEGGVKHPDMLFSRYFGLNPERQVEAIVEVKSSLTPKVREGLGRQLPRIVPDMEKEGVKFSPDLGKFLLLPKYPHGYNSETDPSELEGYQIIFSNFSGVDLSAVERVLSRYIRFGEKGLEQFRPVSEETQARGDCVYPWKRLEKVDENFLQLLADNEDTLYSWEDKRTGARKGSKLVLGPELDGVNTFFQFFDPRRPGERKFMDCEELVKHLTEGEVWMSVYHYFQESEEEGGVSFRGVNFSFRTPRGVDWSEQVEGLTLSTEKDQLVVEGSKGHSVLPSKPTI